jgi:hypothetical protein
MIARPSTRRSACQRPYRLLAALVALALIGLARPAAAQNPPAAPSPGALLVAKQIVELKGARQLFTPLVRGVVEKVKDQFMQTNFMWGKDLNEVAAKLEKDYAPRVDELVDMAARIYASHFTEASRILSVSGRPQVDHRGTEGARREHGKRRQLGRRSRRRGRRQNSRRDEKTRARPLGWPITTSICSSSAAAPAACAPRGLPHSMARALCWPKNIGSAAPA